MQRKTQFGQRIDDHRTRQERSPQVLSRAALNVPNGKQKVHRPLRALRIADARYSRVACLEHQIFIAVAQIRNFGFEPLSEFFKFSYFTR